VNNIIEDFEMFRSERRSFFCSNKLWKRIQKAKENKSVSQFVREAIEEKIKKISL
jgi:predicted CopG family antitoxin